MISPILCFSIDAYRSTRIRKTPYQRPHIKQVIMRKEDVSSRAEEQRGSGSHTSIKQKMKVEIIYDAPLEM